MTADMILLEARLRRELDSLQKLLEEMKISLKLKQAPASSVRLRAISSILHDFYTGAEKIFINIAKEIDGKAPAGEGWHRTLLEQMTLDLPGLRPPLLNTGLADNLKDYLSFRHRFRNLYGFELDWQRMKQLAIDLPGVTADLAGAVEGFITNLKIFSSDDTH
ncbi:MAG: ribonuclease toxin HepT-like protein [Eubacteriales bacterium]